MDELFKVHWYSFSWIDLLELPMPEEVRREEVEALLDWKINKLAHWRNRDAEFFGEYR